MSFVGLIKAIDRFDPSREVKFSTFASVTIVGELKRHFRDTTWALRVPRGLQELGLQVSRVMAELSQSLGRSPTVAEIARSAGLSEESVDDLKIAIGEACANAVIVNEGSAPDVPVKIHWSQEGSHVVVEVEGAGHPLDSAESTNGDDHAARIRMSVALLESLVDSCEVTEGPDGAMTSRLTVNL